VAYLTYGRHVTADCWGVSFEKLDDLNYLKQIITNGISKSGATVIGVIEKQFEPQGVTLLFLLSESHFSLHSYPEENFVALDCYTCGYDVHPIRAMMYVIEEIQPSDFQINQMERGIKNKSR